MESRPSVAKIKKAVAAQFPAEAAVVDAEMAHYDDDAYESWLERFCDTTNDAMARRDESLVDAHLSFLSRQLAETDEEGRTAIDVAYAENLMWNLDVEGKRWAWPRIPANLQQLYIDIWGEARIQAFGKSPPAGAGTPEPDVGDGSETSD